MNSILTFFIILIPAGLVFFLIIRMNRTQLRRAEDMRGKEAEFTSDFRHGLNGTAIVISKNEIIAPNAGGFAKVDCQLEVQLPGRASYQITTSWLVKVESLGQLAIGAKVPVIVHPKKPNQIQPDIPWAKPWIFG